MKIRPRLFGCSETESGYPCVDADYSACGMHLTSGGSMPVFTVGDFVGVKRQGKVTDPVFRIKSIERIDLKESTSKWKCVFKYDAELALQEELLGAGIVKLDDNRYHWFTNGREGWEAQGDEGERR